MACRRANNNKAFRTALISDACLGCIPLIPIDCCLTSDLQTHAIPSFDMHPIRFYFYYGMRVTVNTDNRLVSNTTMTKEYLVCAEHLGFDAEEIRQLIIYGFKSSFLPFH